MSQRAGIRGLSVWLVLLSAALGCSSTESEQTPGGSEPSSDELRTALLSDPVVTLGSQLDGELLFSEITRVVPTPTGGFVVIERGAPRVTVFDSTGVLIASLARRGEGPGEFVHPQEAGFIADTLWIIDATLHRISYFHDGEFIDSNPLGEYPELHPERGSFVPAVLTDRRPLVHTSRLVSPFDLVNVTSSPGLLLVDSGSGLDTILEVNVDYPTGIAVVVDGGEVSAFRGFEQPFSEMTRISTSPDGAGVVAASATADGYSVLRIHPSGDTIRNIRRVIVPNPVPRSVTDSLVVAEVGGAFTEAHIRDAMYLPDRYPPVSEVIAAADGSIWVGREVMPGMPTAWDVHRPTGDMIRVESTGGFQLVVPLSDAVWGLEYDEFDVPYLTLRRLVWD